MSMQSPSVILAEAVGYGPPSSEGQSLIQGIVILIVVAAVVVGCAASPQLRTKVSDLHRRWRGYYHGEQKPPAPPSSPTPGTSAAASPDPAKPAPKTYGQMGSEESNVDYSIYGDL
jgi:hypothetical protein